MKCVDSFPALPFRDGSNLRKPLTALPSFFALLCAISYIFIGDISNANAQEPRISVASRVDRRRDPLKTPSGMIRTDVKLVLIPVTVTDPLQRPVSGLRKQDFRVFDDGIEQNISEFFSEEAPVSVGMVFDASHSMLTKMNQSRQAITEFLKMSVPGDEFFLLKFSDRPATVVPFTTDISSIEDGLTLIQSGGWTSLFDAMYLALNRMKRATYGSKALFVLSDGGDNNSRYTETDITNMVREADVRIFAVSVLDRSLCLERISEESGGRAYRVHKLDQLHEVAETLSAEVHSHYVLGYLPTKFQNDGKYHKVTVKLIRTESTPRLHVAWRRGYYAPLR
jgi:Ca-activated chloride channel homolog